MTMSLPFYLRSYLFLCGPPLRLAMTEDSTSFGIFQLGTGRASARRGWMFARD
jgi:hypothetical protein